MDKKEVDLSEKVKELEETIEHLRFKQDLIFSNSNVDRLLYEYDLKKEQYYVVMNIMDDYREKISKEEKVEHRRFEEEIYRAIPQQKNNYHFAEELARTFWDDGRWEEVFIKLYGSMEKYMYLKRNI